METFIWVVAAAVFLVAVLYLLLVVFADESSDQKARDERAQAEFDQRGQAALDALRELGRKYPRR